MRFRNLGQRWSLHPLPSLFQISRHHTARRAMAILRRGLLPPKNTIWERLSVPNCQDPSSSTSNRVEARYKKTRTLCIRLRISPYQIQCKQVSRRIEQRLQLVRDPTLNASQSLILPHSNRWSNRKVWIRFSKRLMHSDWIRQTFMRNLRKTRWKEVVTPQWTGGKISSNRI